MRIYEEQLQLRLLFTLRDTAGKRACLHAHLPANATSSRGDTSYSIMDNKADQLMIQRR